MKQQMNEISINTAPVPLRVKANVKITLTNAKTGEQEIIEKHNMETNGIAEYLTNLGWMNSDNLTKSNLVKQMLGGILMFDDEISEDATIIKSPGGLNMIANGACEVSNGQTVGDPTEMGSWIQESDTGSGWKDDGTYHFVWEWGLEQGNGTIASACLTSKEWGYVGEGNSKSDLQKPSSVTSMSICGSPTVYTIRGQACRLDVEDSSVYGIEFDTENLLATIRKYRIPLTKANLKTTPTDCVVLSESTISIPQSLVDCLNAIPSNYRPDRYDRTIQDTGETLVIFNKNAGTTEWGNGFTQYMWEIDPVAETCVEITMPNLYSGERTMYGMRKPIFLNKDIVAWVNGNYYVYGAVSQNDIIYSMKRTNGTWGNFKSCASTGEWGNEGFRWRGHKAMILGDDSSYTPIIYDYDNNSAYKCNYRSNSIQGTGLSLSHDKDLVFYLYSNISSTGDIRVYRDESYIATIWNAETPYEKTAEKFMRVDYKVSFIEEPEEES